MTATVTDPNNDVLGGMAEARLVGTTIVVSATIDSGFLRGTQFGAILRDQPAGTTKRGGPGDAEDALPRFSPAGALSLPALRRPGAPSGAPGDARSPGLPVPRKRTRRELG